MLRDQTEISATVFNLSSAGVLLFAAGKLPWNGLVSVELDLEGQEPSVVNYRGKVRRMGLEREGLVAIVFENMSDTETARLRECVMKRALNQIVYLSQFPAFRDLSDLDLLALTSVCHEVHLKSGVYVAKFGDEADSVFLIKRGSVRLLSPRSQDGETESQEVEVARAGQLFGEASALLKLPHNLDVVAIEDTELLLIPAAAMVYGAPGRRGQCQGCGDPAVQAGRIGRDARVALTSQVRPAGGKGSTNEASGRSAACSLPNPIGARVWLCDC